jgi:nucleoside 2-deoxyribosyltransferase
MILCQPMICLGLLRKVRGFMKKLTVYLAGGFGSGWQDKVKQEVERVTFLDPSTHGLKEPDEYTVWDLELIRQSNIIFAYLELSNPSGYGLNLEIGYAKALGKMVILVNEKRRPQDYMDMTESACDMVYGNLEDGIEFLKRISSHIGGI